MGGAGVLKGKFYFNGMKNYTLFFFYTFSLGILKKLIKSSLDMCWEGNNWYIWTKMIFLIDLSSNSLISELMRSLLNYWT